MKEPNVNMDNETSVPKTEKASEQKPDDLDSVLAEVGEFGKYQIFHFFLLSIMIILSAICAVDYIVTSSTLDYRFRNFILNGFVCICIVLRCVNFK